MQKWLSLILLAAVGCGIVKTEDLEDDVRSRIIDDLRFATSQVDRRDSLRIDGIYSINSNPLSPATDSLIMPIQFLPNGLIIRDRESYADKQEYIAHWTKTQERVETNNTNLDDIFCGFYFVKNQVVHAWVPLFYNRTRVSWSEVVLTHFEGDWIDENTIANWHLSEPFILPKDWPEEGEEHYVPDRGREVSKLRSYYNYQRWERLQNPVEIKFHELPNPKTSSRYNFVKLSEYLNIEIIVNNS